MSTEIDTEPIDGTDEGAGMKRLRDEIKRRDRRIADLKHEVASREVRLLGLDPGRGIGRAVLDQINDPLDSDKIRSLATRYGWSPTAVEEQFPDAEYEFD